MLGTIALAAVLQAPLAAQEARTGTVSGQVVDALGEPVPLADVWITKERDSDELARTKADGSGMFSLGRLAEGEYLLLHATAPDRTEAWDWVRPNPTDAAWLRLWDAGTVVGRVVDADGRPIAGAEVIAASEDNRVLHWDHGSATTDDDGRYELARVPLGEVRVLAYALGHLLGESRVALRDRAECGLALPSGEGVRITVRIEGVDARELGRTRVSLSSRTLPRRLQSGTPDENGIWTRSGLPDLGYTAIRVDDPELNFQPRTREIEKVASAHEVVFRALRPSSTTLRGKLLDPQSRPLAQQTFVCRAASGGREARVVTDDQGNFTMQSPLAPGGEVHRIPDAVRLGARAAQG
jgi:hypothetical protein